LQRIGCYVTPCRSNHNYETRVETVEAEYRERREVQDSSLRYMYLRIGFILGQQEVLIRRTSISLLKGWVTSNPILEGGRSWFLITKYIEEGEELFCISSKHSNYAWTYSKVVIPWLWEDLLHDTSLASLLGLEKGPMMPYQTESDSFIIPRYCFPSSSLIRSIKIRPSKQL